MTNEQIEQLIKLIQLAATEDIRLPNLPLPLFKAVASFVPLIAVEVILVDKKNRFLLTYREDEYWKGWHIPGGFIGYGESLPLACTRISQRELNIEVEFMKVLHAQSWENRHPYSAPVSIFCLCKMRGEQIPCDGTFFSKHPKDTIEFHKEFFEKNWN